MREDLESSAPARATDARIQEDEIGLDDLWRMLRRRSGIVAVVCLLFLGAAAVYTLTRSTVWRASVLIRVESEPGELFRDQTLLSQSPENIATEMRIVRTRPVLAEVVDRLDLAFRIVEPTLAGRSRLLRETEFDRSTPFARYEVARAGDRYRLRSISPDSLRIEQTFQAGDTVWIPGGWFVLATSDGSASGGSVPERLVLATTPFENAVEGLRQRLAVTRPDSRAELFEISLRGSDRSFLPDIVTAVAEAFLAQRQSVRTSEARGAAAFLQDQTAQIEAQLAAAEEALQEFREERQVVELEAQAREQVARLADLEAQRAQLDAERDALGRILRTIDSGESNVRPNYRSLVGFPTFLSNQTVGTLVQSLVDAEAQRTQLRERWSPEHPSIVAFDSTIHTLEARLGEIGRDYLDSLNDQIASLDAVLARFGSDLERVPGRELQFARLERRVRLLSDLHSLLEQRLKQAEVTEALSDPSVRIVEPAVLPRRPVSPRPARNMVLAGFLGLLAGLGLGFVREVTDDRLRGDEDLEAALGVPVLTRVPATSNGTRGASRKRLPLLIEDGGSARGEAYRALRTRLVPPGTASGPVARLVVTSPGAGEGKSITAANLAAAFARQGHRTLLVDADLRRGILHTGLSVAPSPGLSDVLAGEAQWAETIATTAVSSLDLLPAGSPRSDPAELLTGPRLKPLLKELRADYEVMIFDSPPVLAVTDAVVLAGFVGEAILVIRAGRTPGPAARDSLQELRRTDAELPGIVLQGVKADRRYGSGYSVYGNGTGGSGGRSRLWGLLRRR